MKEFSSQTGGRYTYIDDILNLQDLALSLSSIFADCGNFVISGCNVYGTTISEGYVFLNGKVRKFNGVQGVTSWPQYIYEDNREETVAYQSGADKVGRRVYGCAVGDTVPTTFPLFTNEVPQSLIIRQTGPIMTLKEAFFGRYSVLLNPQSTAGQSVHYPVAFLNGIKAQNIGQVETIDFSKGSNIARLQNISNTLSLYHSQSDGKVHQFRVSEVEDFVFAINGSNIVQIKNNGVLFTQPIHTTKVSSGNIQITGSSIANVGTAANGSIHINMEGYNNAGAYYRSTYIGNGKGTALLKVEGAEGLITATCSFTQFSGDHKGVILKSTMAKTNNQLKKVIEWQDTNGERIAVIGYDDAANTIMAIQNVLGDIDMIGKTAVNIGPVIKEGGTLLSEKYVLRSQYNAALGNKIDSANVYTKTESDQTFAKKDGGLSQFIDSSHTAAQLCQEIGALCSTDMTSYVAKDQYLADMATTDALKRRIRENIGAAGINEYQPKMTDTGWVQVQTNLYARQIGNIVCIQGTLVTMHDGVAFTLPNNISAPKYAVAFSSHKSQWEAKIDANNKQCKVVYCSYHGNTIAVSFTYMV